MTETPPSTLQIVEDADATGRVREIFDDIKSTKDIDFVPAFWQAIAINVAQLETVWSSVKRLMHPEADGHASRLDPVTREIIAVAVSATNGCAYCLNSHTTVLQKLGLDSDSIGEVMAIAGLFNMTNTIANGLQVEPDIRPDRSGDS